MYRFWTVLSVVMVLCVTMASGVKADPDYSVFETHEWGTVNWSMRTVRAHSSVTPLEKTSPRDLNKQDRLVELARSQASSNLIASILSLPLDSERLASSAIGSNSDIMDQIKAMVNQSRLIKKDYLTDGSVEMVIEMSFDGGFSQLLLPEEIQQIQPLKTVTERTSEKGLVSQESDPNPDVPVPFTGLIVDTRGLTVHPVLSPILLDENGQEVYGPAYISREYAVQNGPVYYSQSIKDPFITQRVGENPLVVTGLKTQGTFQGDIVISNADASKLHSNSAHLVFLNHCLVVILIDSGTSK
ncbi:MAG: hypothetical protein KKD44_03210 [Proteobacteria bacterium]|nr:hypothetical protein [Pseudomonadota bacterium]